MAEDSDARISGNTAVICTVDCDEKNHKAIIVNARRGA